MQHKRYFGGHMPFDTKQFLKTKFSPRTFAFPVPEMRAFFSAGEDPVWKVRGLTGHELGRAAEAADKHKTIVALLEGLTADSSKDKADAVKTLLGLGGDTPADIAKRLEHLAVGSVDPKCPQDLAVRICETFPVEFYQLTNKIYELTGQGQVPGKLPPSGEMAGSGTASPSATPGGDSSLK
jgi:hypothetical protein